MQNWGTVFSVADWSEHVTKFASKMERDGAKYLFEHQFIVGFGL